ncbi:MAG: putative membrane protein [Methanobacterium sp. Maddingley MBC34]|nr:MAG: putative membrane protein [Methanobacterium sp. Maddingley MBC34]
MKLSSQKDLLLIIILSGAVLLMSWLKLLKGYPLSLLPTILVLILPGYALITAIWPSDEKMRWTIRAGLGFVLGVFFILFLPLIFTSLKLSAFTGTLNQILLILTILFSLVAMTRRRGSKDKMEPLRKDAQLTLEESIQRATLMRQKAEAKSDEYEDHYEGDEEYIEEEYYEEDTDEEEFYHEDLGKETYEEPEKEVIKEELEEEEREIEPQKYQDLKKEKPLQYERIKDKYHLDEDELPPSEDKHVPEDHEYGHDEEDHPSPEQPKGVPLRVEQPMKTFPTDYEAEMDKPVWTEESSPQKSSFRNWDLVMILFLSGISLLFLYFNPLKTTTTSIVFFILLLFILGYTGLTIIFPDKSRVSSRNLMLASIIIAVILFILSFLAWNMGLLPSVPKYLVKIMFVASIIMVAGAFLRKWRTGQDRAEKVPADHMEEISPDHEEVFEEEEETFQDHEEEPEPWKEPEETEEPQGTEEVEKPEETPEKEPAKSEELTPSQTEKEETLKKLQSISTPLTTDKSGIIAHGDIKKTPPSFKPRNYYMDIILVAAITLLTVAFVLIPPLNKTFIRTIMGILLVLFIPGYSLITALFPKWGDLDGIERAALSFGLSIAVTPLIGLALNYTPWGIRLDPILISLTIFTMAMCVIAFLRRRKLAEEERFFVPFGQFVKGIKGSFKGESKTERILSIILIITIILAISTTVYIIVKPKQGEKFTEFYILGPNGTASNYPTNLTTGQNGSMIIGVVNHEYATTDYLLVVKINGTILKNQTMTLTNGQKVEIPYTFTAGSTGQKKLEFLLYKLPDNETAYRSLHLWLNVR